MATVTAEQVRAAHSAGRQAGYTLQPPTPNPYAPPHVDPWKMPRDPQQRAALEKRNSDAVLLARVWRAAYRDGQVAYAHEHGLPTSN